MTVLSFPTLNKRSLLSCEFSLVTNTQTFTSPLSGQVQTVGLPGARWTCTLAFQNESEQDGRIIKAFVAAMRGAAGRCYLGDLSHVRPSGAIRGSGQVSGAGQVGASLNTSGWGLVAHAGTVHADSTAVTADSGTLHVDSSDLGYSNAFLPGDLIGVNGELKMITQPATVDSNGNAVLTFEPPLRSTPANGAAIITDAPTCTMRLIDDNQGKMVMQQGRLFSPVLSFVEVF